MPRLGGPVLTPVTIIGVLDEQPQLRENAEGQVCTVFMMRTSSQWFDPDALAWREVLPEFYECTAWDQQARNIVQCLPVGARLVVCGRLTQMRAQTIEGDVAVTGVTADEVGASVRFTTLVLKDREPSDLRTAPVATPLDQAIEASTRWAQEGDQS